MMRDGRRLRQRYARPRPEARRRTATATSAPAFAPAFVAALRACADKAAGLGPRRRPARPGCKPFPRSACLPRKPSGETMATDLDLLQGTLDVLVLKTLSWGPRH